MTVNKITNAPTQNETIDKINEIIDNLGGGTATDVQINGTSITSNNVANIVTESAYNASSNKIATMSDVSVKQNKLTAGTDLEIIESDAPLPSGYTRLQFIQSNGTQYINTGYTMTSNVVEYGIVMYGRAENSISVSLFGSEYSGSNIKYSGVPYGSGSTGPSLFIGSSGGIISTTFEAALWNKYIVKTTSSTNGTVSINGEITSFTYLNGIQKILPLYLFANNKDNTAVQKSSIKVKSFYIKDNNVLVRNLVAARRESDNAIGMFDTLNNTFYTNAGTDSFIAGEVAPETTGTTIRFTNDSGYITGITSSDVTTALGYTPYDSSNPSGYTTNTGTVTSVNNVSPVNGNVTLSIPAAQVNSDWNATSGKAQILNKPSLATVATSGSYNDLSNKPTIPAAVTVDSALSSTSTNPVQNKVINSALAGKYDASNPNGYTSNVGTVTKVNNTSPDSSGNVTLSIPAAQIQSDWTQTTTTAKDYIKNKPSLSTVATSGSYNDLTNKPTIPTVNNATLTIQKNGTTVKTFTANASSNVTCNITVPTNTNELTNGAGFITGITSSDVTTALGYTPYSSANPNGYTSNVGTVTSVNNVSPVNGNVSLSIPTVNNGTLTIQKNGTTVKTFTANASSNVTCNITVPTKTSDITNDSGYTTNTGTVTSVNNVSPVNGNVTLTIPSEVTESTVSGWGFTKNTGTVTSVNNVSPVNGNVSLSIPTVPTNISAFNNDSGYITGINSTDVTTALGYTPTSPANVDGQWVAKVKNDFTVSPSKTTVPQEFNLKTLNYLPNDNNKYEVLVCLYVSAGTGGASTVYLSSDIVSGNGITVVKNDSKYENMNLPIPVTSTLKVQVTQANAGDVTLRVLGYRRIGTNS